MLNRIKEVSFRANIEPVWNTKVRRKPVELGFLELNYFSREERGPGSTLDFSPRILECGLETDGYAFVRIRTLRRELRGVRGEIHASPAPFSGAIDQVPGVQEAGSSGMVNLQLTQDALDLGRQESRVHRPEAG